MKGSLYRRRYYSEMHKVRIVPNSLKLPFLVDRLFFNLHLAKFAGIV